jgi:hypothetical protein
MQGSDYFFTHVAAITSEHFLLAERRAIALQIGMLENFSCAYLNRHQYQQVVPFSEFYRFKLFPDPAPECTMAMDKQRHIGPETESQLCQFCE